MFKKIRLYYKYIKNKRYDTLAGTLSFFFILSFIPLLYLCLSIYVQIGEFWEIATPIPDIITRYISFDLHAGVSIFFIITTLYSSSQLFFQIKRTGEIIYNEKRAPSQFKYKIISCVFVLILIFISSFGLLAFSIAQTYLANKVNKIIIQLLSLLLIYIMLFIFLYFTNKYASNNKLSFKETKPGIIFTISYTTIVSIGFLIYVLYFANYEFLYGVFSTIIIAFIYIYLIMRGIISGIIINERKYRLSK